MLVNGGVALLNQTVNRDHLPGVEGDNIIRLKRLEGNLHFAAIYQNPDGAGLLGKDIDQALLGAVLGDHHQLFAQIKGEKAKAARHKKAAGIRADKIERTHHIHTQPPLNNNRFVAVAKDQRCAVDRSDQGDDENRQIKYADDRCGQGWQLFHQSTEVLDKSAGRARQDSS